MTSTDETKNPGKPPVMIKKYANRRLYNTETSVYVTLEDLAEMVQRGEEFTVTDAKTGEDLTRSVLTQIITELENKGQNLLPVSFLRQLIRFYGDSLQTLIPGFLDMSLQNFTRDKERWQKQMTAFGMPFEALEDQIKQNMKLFESAFSVFTPFAKGNTPAEKVGAQDNEMENLRAQLKTMQQQIDRLREEKL